MAATVRDKLIGLIEPLLAGLGYELVDVEFAPGRGQAHLTVYLDRAEGVGIEDCERASREISALLDVHDPVPQAYTLEVSSPGLDRLLRTPAHYARFVGARVAMELALPREGRRRWTGRLVRADASGIGLEVDGNGVSAAYGEIAHTRLVPEWPEKAGKGRRK